MTLLDALYAQGARAFREPRAAAADVIALGVPREALAPALFLIVALSAIVNAPAEFISPSPMNGISHFQMTVFLLVLFGTFAAAIYKIGQAMGGVGTWQDSLLLAVFFQAIFLPAQVLQVVLMASIPVLSGLFALFLFVFGIWVNVNFIAALHGFSTLGRAFGVLILASIAVAVVMMVAAPMIGISFFAGNPNV